MKQYWERHQGKSRWGERATRETPDARYQSESGTFSVWADRVDPPDGNLVFLNDEGEIQGSIVAGCWDAAFEVGADDAPQVVEMRS